MKKADNYEMQMFYYVATEQCNLLSNRLYILSQMFLYTTPVITGIGE